MRPLHLLSRRASVAFVLALAGLSASAEPGVEPRRLLIGQTLTLQGGRNDYGLAVQEGVAAYLKGVNAQGGVAGRQLVLRVLDDDNQATRAEANARTLIDQDGVFLLFGSIEGGPSTAVMKVAAERQVPFFAPMAGSPTLRRPHQPMVFPVRAEHREEFRALLDYARKTGVTRAAFMRADSDTGRQHLENVQRLCAELGLQLVADLPFRGDPGDAQIADMTRRLGSSQAQVVLNHGSAGAYERLIRAARAQGLGVTFFGVNSGSAQLVRHLGPLAHGMVFSQVVPSPWERKSAITRDYQEAMARLRPDAEFSYASLEGYLSARALVAALRLAGPQPTREGFVQALEQAGTLDLAGLKAVYRPGDHTGLSLVDLAVVTRDGRFRH